MTLFIHDCGKRYLQSATDAPPPRCKLVVCDNCLEPMPVCDELRRAYAYQAVGDYSLRRVIPARLTAKVPAVAA